MTLSTARAPMSRGEAPRAVFGDPRIEWKRPAADVRRSVGVFVTRARAHGLRDALKLATDAAGPREDEGRYAAWVQRNTPSADDLRAMAAAAATLPYKPLISVVTPVYNTEPRGGTRRGHGTGSIL